MADLLRVAPVELYPRRLAWRALSMVLDQHALRDMAIRLNPDDPRQCLPGVAFGQIDFFEDYLGGAGRTVAIVLLDGERARVLVERVEWLIRRNHLPSFRPAEIGITRRRGQYDIDVTVDLGEVVAVEGERMRTARQTVLPEASRPRRKPEVARAYGGVR